MRAVLQQALFRDKRSVLHEITAVRKNNSGSILIIGKKKIALEYLGMDGFYFEWYAVSKYKDKYGKEPPLDKSVPAWDIFKGHVEKPEEMMLVLVMFLLFILAIPVYVLYQAHDVIVESETMYMECYVSSYEIDDHTLVLKSDNYEGEFLIYRYKEYGSSIPKMLETLEKEPILYLNVLETGKSDSGNTEYEIYNVHDKYGKVYLTFDAVNESNKKYAYEVFEISSLFV